VLMGVSGTLDVVGIMLGRGQVDAVQQRLLDAQEHVFRGNKVLQRLLDFARGMPQDVTEVRLDALIADAVALCKAHPASRGVRLNVELSGELPTVRADAGQLHEVLMNLILNALQATAERGVVTISAAREGEQVHLLVVDTGCGIAPDHLERIFEAFFSHRQNGPPGTGIGLPASLRMVRGMGGDIGVTSTVGKGTTFTVSLPIDSTPRSLGDAHA
jgi:two-component system NtrC family sensor kinase